MPFPTPTIPYRIRKLKAEETEWRHSMANLIAHKHLAFSIRSVFDHDDIRAVALASMEKHQGEHRAFQYRAAVNAVVDVKRSLAGCTGKKTALPLATWENGEALEQGEEDPEIERVTNEGYGASMIAQVTDPAARRVLELIFLDGVEFGKDNEAAKRLLGVSNATVSRLKHRGLAELRGLIEKE